MFSPMLMFACARLLWVHIGHPEAARPDVQEFGLCGVMNGSLADSADLEQCTQVSPTNELTIQKAHDTEREPTLSTVSIKALHIWQAEIFMLVLAPDQRTRYKMQISIHYLMWSQFVDVRRWTMACSFGKG